MISHNNLLSDTAVGIVVCICYFFRHHRWVSYLSPVSSLLLSIIFLIGYAKHIAESVKELTDHSLPEEISKKIQQIVDDDIRDTAKVNYLQTHLLNRKVYIDLSLIMNDDATIADQKTLRNRIYKDIENVIPGVRFRMIVE